MEKSYEERQRECGLKVGDKVKILRRAEAEEEGWNNDWCESMNEFIGKIGKVISNQGEAGIKVEVCEFNNWWYFPYFVLEKVEDNETPKHVEPVKREEKKLTNYSVFTTNTREKAFNFEAISKEENNESIIFTKEDGTSLEFYKKHIVAIKKA